MTAQRLLPKLQHLLLVDSVNVSLNERSGPAGQPVFVALHAGCGYCSKNFG
jgi:hypothetical protein